jgi:dihydrofolate reductase
MKFRVYIATSVDGFVAPPDGGVAWLEPYSGEGDPYGYQRFIAGIDAIVIGRTTFDQALTFPEWPYADKDVYVLTTRPLQGQHPRTLAWHGSPGELVTHLRGCARDVWLLGGPGSLQPFRELGAIDEFEIFVLPVLLGGGVALFPRGAHASLKLLDHTVYPDGVVRLVYAPVREQHPGADR